MRWCIFYGDGLVFYSEDGPPEEAPDRGVIAVVHENSGVYVEHQSDWYWIRDDRWWGGDVHGFLDQAGRFGAMWPKQGQTIRPDEYQDIMARVVELKNEWS